MTGGPARWFRELTGRSAALFIDLLTKQLDADVAAIELIEQSLRGAEPADIEAAIGDVERAGDAARTALVAELTRAVSTPVDPEDLFRISRSIDDVLDNLRDFARELHRYQPERLDRFPPLLDATREGLHSLRHAVTCLADLSTVPAAAKRAGKDSNEIRRRYQDAMADLLHQALDMDVLRQRELLRRLDVVGLRLHEAADALADAVWKRSQ